MGKGKFLLLSCGAILVGSSIRLAGQDPTPDSRLKMRAEMMHQLAAQLEVHTQEDAARYTPEFRDRLTGQARALLKSQVLETLARTSGDPNAVAAALKPLGQSGWDRDSGVPCAIRGSLFGVPVVVTGFQFVRGPSGAPDIKAFIQAYRSGEGSSWEFVAEAGDDLDGYILHLRLLNSPRADEMWLLAYGIRTGSNNLTLRMRVYAFDGEKFINLLSPPDRPYGEVQVLGGEIVVKSVDYEADKWIRTERYWLSLSGITRMSSTVGVE